MKILVAIDASKFSEAAVKALVAQGSARDTEILVLHVVQPTECLGYSIPESKQQRRKAEELVDRAKRILCAARFRVNTEVLVGEPSATVVGRAQEWNADLIVVGSHGRTGLRRFFLGSVSDAIVRRARCSVEIVRTADRLRLDQPLRRAS